MKLMTKLSNDFILFIHFFKSGNIKSKREVQNSNGTLQQLINDGITSNNFWNPKLLGLNRQPTTSRNCFWSMPKLFLKMSLPTPGLCWCFARHFLPEHHRPCDPGSRSVRAWCATGRVPRVAYRSSEARNSRPSQESSNSGKKGTCFFANGPPVLDDP